MANILVTDDGLSFYGFSPLVLQAETTSTPSGASPSQTINLNTGSHQTLACTSASGTIAVTFTVPTGYGSMQSGAGTLIVKQHAVTPVDISWAASSGSVVWLGTEPTWASDAASAIRVVSWRHDGTDTYLAATESN